jgi:hypothetical protein
VVDRIKHLSSDGYNGAKFNVLSYDGFTLSKAASLNITGITVTSTNLAAVTSNFRKNVVQSIRASLDVRPSSASPLPLELGIELTKSVLRAGNHTSEATAMRQLNLRRTLSDQDARAAKNPHIPESISLINSIVNAGLRDKWLRRSLLHGVSGADIIWLEEKSEKVESSEISPEVSAQVSVALTKQDEPQADDKGEQRTLEFTKYLRESGFYVQKDVRDLLLSEAAELADGSKTVAQLFREATKRAKSSAESKNISCRNWPAATEAIIKLALASGLLVDFDDGVLSDSFRSRGMRVKLILPQSVDKIDVFLLCWLVRGIHNITSRDANSLAHALYKQAPKVVSRDEMVDRVHEVIALAGPKIIETGESLSYGDC